MKSVSSFLYRASLHLCLYMVCGCRNNQNNAAFLQQLDEGIVQSNRLIRLVSADVLEAIAQKTYERTTAERAKEIYPKAAALQRKTDSVFACIETLGSLLNKNGATVLPSNSIEALYATLAEYKRAILSLDKRMSEELSEAVFLVSKDLDSSQKIVAALNENLQDAPVPVANAFLHRIENNLAIDEQKAMNFLRYRTALRRDNFTFFEAIVGQNAQILEAGRPLEITAGMGSFTKDPVAQIAVDGRFMPLNEKGLMVYRMKTPSKPGAYSVPVQIKFTDRDGTEQARTITVQYKTVAAHAK